MRKVKYAELVDRIKLRCKWIYITFLSGLITDWLCVT